jgi:hypothetical protein
MVYATITGARMRQVLEHSIDSATGGKFMDVSGLKFGWDPQKPKGERLVFILAHKHGQWQPLDDKDTFRIAMTDYSFLGGEGFDFKDATDVHETHKKLNLYFRHYLEQTKSVGPQWPNRIVALSGAASKGVLSGDFGDSLTGFARPTVTVLTGDNMGVRFETEDRPSTTVPLDSSTVLQTGLSPQQARAYLQSKSGHELLKTWTVLVVRANGPKNKHTTLVSYPLTMKDLQQ